MANQYFVYILKCSDDTYYTGITNDIEHRLHHHNNTKSGAKYTRVRRPVELIYSEPALGRAEATKRERQIKKLTRSQKELLLNFPKAV